MRGLIPQLEIRDPDAMFAFYCWANWNLDPEEWIVFYQPSIDDWNEFIEDTRDEGVEESTIFYLWAVGRIDTYLPTQEHLAKFIAMSN